MGAPIPPPCPKPLPCRITQTQDTGLGEILPVHLFSFTYIGDICISNYAVSCAIQVVSLRLCVCVLFFLDWIKLSV